jgi:hypothetical protein
MKRRASFAAQVLQHRRGDRLTLPMLKSGILYEIGTARTI